MTCAGCGGVGASPCRGCIHKLIPAKPPCPAGVDSCAAAFLFTGVGRTLISSLKYQNQRQSLAWLSSAVAQLVLAQNPARLDVVTWVPTTARRRRSRGYDQAELLARRVARRLRVDSLGLLLPQPSRSSASQTGLNAAERYERVAFRAHRKAVGLSVLVIDDVITTGASIEAAAAALRSVGASQVHAGAAAFTPAPADR